MSGDGALAAPPAGRSDTRRPGRPVRLVVRLVGRPAGESRIVCCFNWHFLEGGTGQPVRPVPVEPVSTCCAPSVNPFGQNDYSRSQRLASFARFVGGVYTNTRIGCADVTAAGRRHHCFVLAWKHCVRLSIYLVPPAPFSIGRVGEPLRWYGWVRGR